MKQIGVKHSGPAILQGNEASAMGALAAGCSFFAGYPITPASEVPEIMSRAMFEAGGTYMQMEDELASICAVIGARWGGARAMTATSGPGFSLMQEALGYAVVSETPVVILDVMRGGPSTGQPTSSAQQDVMQARYGSHGDYEIIALCPASVQEAFDFTVRAFNLAEEFRVPVIVLSDEILGHMREKVIIPETVDSFDDYNDDGRPLFAPDHRGIPVRTQFFEGRRVLVDGQLHDARGIRAGHLPDLSAAAVRRYCEKIADNADAITAVQRYDLDDAETVVVAYGTVSRSALSAVRRAREAGIRAGLLKLDTLWPVPERAIDEACAGARRVVVPEMNIGQYVKEVARIAGRDKVMSLPLLGGVLHTPAHIYESVVGVTV